MKTAFNSTASFSNYRHYIGAGTTHVVLIDAFAPNRFYSETSGDEAFSDWVTKVSDDENENGDKTDVRYDVFGDPLHSKPIVVNYGDINHTLYWQNSNV